MPHKPSAKTGNFFWDIEKNNIMVLIHGVGWFYNRIVLVQVPDHTRQRIVVITICSASAELAPSYPVF